jgi:hypothetical protein
MVASGKNHYKWRGDSVTIGQLHAWLRKEMLKTKPLVCERCGGTSHVQVANMKEHIYTRKPDDYIFLCSRCHNIMDGHFDNLVQGKNAILNSTRLNPDITEKRCTKCNIIKPLADFYTDDDIYRAECKTCTISIHKEKYRKDNPGAPLLLLYSNLENGVRVCRKCGKTKPLCEFNKSSGRKSGTASFCKECTRRYSREKYTKKTPETSRVMKQRIEIANGVRTCKICKMTKPLSEFAKNDNSTRASCKACYNTMQRERRMKNKEKYPIDDVVQATVTKVER